MEYSIQKILGAEPNSGDHWRETYFAADKTDLVAAIWLIGRANLGRQGQNRPRPEGISPKLPSPASTELEIEYYSGARFPESEQF